MLGKDSGGGAPANSQETTLRVRAHTTNRSSQSAPRTSHQSFIHQRLEATVATVAGSYGARPSSARYACRMVNPAWFPIEPANSSS